MAAKLLVVEDEQDLREGMAEFFSSKGFETSMAANLPEALEAVNKSRPDAVVSDLMLSQGNGLMLYRELKKQSNKWNPCFILVSGHASLENALEAIHMGIDDYLVKPLEMETLAMALNQGLALRRVAGKEELKVKFQVAEDFYQDLTAPFNMMKSGLEMMAQGRFGDLEEIQSEKLDQSLQHLGNLFSTLQNFYPRLLEPKPRPGVQEAYSAPEVLARAQEEFLADFEREQVSLVVKTPAGLPRAFGDPETAWRVMRVLLFNCLALSDPETVVQLSWGREKDGLSLNLEMSPAPFTAMQHHLALIPFSCSAMEQAGLILYSQGFHGPWKLHFRQERAQ